MSLLDITSANSSLRCVVPGLFPGGFTFEDYSADSMFTVAPVTNKETLMSADGKYHAGRIFNEKEFTVNLSPTSPTLAYLDQWDSYEDVGLVCLPCNMTLTIPALDSTWNLVNGVLFTWAPAPSAGRVLQPRQAVFHFESIRKA